MNVLEQILENFQDEEILKADGFDDAVIGIDMNSMRLIYSISKVMEILVSEQGMDEEDAREHFDFNIGGAWVGEQTPIWCEDYWSWN